MGVAAAVVAAAVPGGFGIAEWLTHAGEWQPLYLGCSMKVAPGNTPRQVAWQLAMIAGPKGIAAAAIATGSDAS